MDRQSDLNRRNGTPRHILCVQKRGFQNGNGSFSFTVEKQAEIVLPSKKNYLYTLCYKNKNKKLRNYIFCCVVVQEDHFCFVFHPKKSLVMKENYVGLQHQFRFSGRKFVFQMFFKIDNFGQRK